MLPFSGCLLTLAPVIACGHDRLPRETIRALKERSAEFEIDKWATSTDPSLLSPTSISNRLQMPTFHRLGVILEIRQRFSIRRNLAHDVSYEP